MAGRLTDAERAEKLAALADWTHDAERDAISRTFRFKDFRGAFGWMTAVALAAEKADHHPEWSNTYNAVHVTLTTHDAGGLTQKDLDLAAEMDRRAG